MRKRQMQIRAMEESYKVEQNMVSEIEKNLDYKRNQVDYQTRRSMFPDQMHSYDSLNRDYNKSSKGTNGEYVDTLN